MLMKSLRYIIVIIALGACGHLPAQNGVKKLASKVGTTLDSMSVSSVDRRYIEAPEKPWQLILRGNVMQTIVGMKDLGIAYKEEYNFDARLKTVPSQYVGFWAGYRGYGFGYTMNVGGDKGSYFTIGATGGSYGINVRIHSFESSRPNIDMTSDLLTAEDMEEMKKVVLIDPIRVNTVIADGYYIFNGKKFSYPAAYDQSVIQKHSAGSLIAGLMYNYTHIDYSADSNGDMIFLMDGLGRVKLWQGSVGAGYAYNWVPTRGLLVNVMAMPMLTFINRLKAYGYETNLPEMMDDPMFWNDQISYEEWDKWYYDNVRIKPIGEQTFNSSISIGFDARVSLTYNFGRFFINAYGQFNNIRYRHNSTNGYLNDWFVNTSLGLRL
jgi:hypothetical protein